MAELTPDIIEEVLAACRAGAQEAAEAFSRALDASVEVAVGEAGAVDFGALGEAYSGPGLAIVLTIGRAGAVLLLPEAGGLVPSWCAQPDATGEAKLTTLGQELGMTLLPEQYMPEDFQAARVDNLLEALRRGGVSQGAAVVELVLSAEQKRAEARLVWPASAPAAVLGVPAAEPSAQRAGERPAAAESSPSPPREPARKARRVGLNDLPSYARSLLRIKVPVIVTLAEKRQSISQIVELGPGSILQFDKSCEEMLDLAVDGRCIARGEAVKVGDKFGLRIMSIVLPEERFCPVAGR